MELNRYELCIFLLVSCLFGMVLTLSDTTTFISHLEVSVALTLITAVINTIAAQQLRSISLPDSKLRSLSEVTTKLTDIEEIYRKLLALLEASYQAQCARLQDDLTRAENMYQRLSDEYDWMTGIYQDQVRALQEHADRIAFLENRMQESGHMESAAGAPYSAPPNQIQFANPPQRARFRHVARNLVGGPGPGPSPLSQVMANTEE